MSSPADLGLVAAADAIAAREITSTELLEAQLARLDAVIAEIAARNFTLDAGDVLDALLEREVAGSTGVGHGVAVPHAVLGLEPSDHFHVFHTLARLE